MDPFGTSATLGHTALDAAGFIPGVGNVFDAVNALWYLAQGDWTNAGLSAIAVIPIVGDITSGTKIAVKTVKAADELADAAKVAEKSVDLNKLNHIFGNTEHNLNEILKVYNGDQAKAYQAIESEAQKYVTKNGITGVINASNQITINVSGFNVTVRGNVTNGIFKMGTSFIR